MSLHEWKFAPIRPHNFPTFRIAPLAAIIHACPHLWDAFSTGSSMASLQKDLQVKPSAYWDSHFILDKPSKAHSSVLSSSALQHLIINVTAPLLMAYSQYADLPDYAQRAMNLLISLPKENNRVSRLWQKVGWRVANAFDSQGLHELYDQYCMKRRCLDCIIGHQLLRS